MNYKEFQKQDMMLLAQIADLRMDSEDKMSEIALNNKEIARLEFKRTELRTEYAGSPDLN